jgi:hypothetical protein
MVMAEGLGLLENRLLDDSPEKAPFSAPFASRTSPASAGRVGGEMIFKDINWVDHPSS